MGKSIILLAIVFVIIFTMSGCKKDSQFSFEKIKYDEADKKITNQIDMNLKSNGVYLIYLNDKKDLYLFLNNNNYSQQEEVLEFSDVKIEAKGGTITVSLNECNNKYSSDKKYVGKQLYKINKDKEYEFIKLFINGQESHFDSIGVF